MDNILRETSNTALDKQMNGVFSIGTKLAANHLTLKLSGPTGEPDSIEGTVSTQGPKPIQWKVRWMWRNDRWQCCGVGEITNLIDAFSQDKS